MTKTFDITATDGLDELLRRLKPGMVVKARIVDIIDYEGYIVRIYGYNILTQSKQKFEKYQEVELTIREVYPHLILDFNKRTRRSIKNSGINIIV